MKPTLSLLLTTSLANLSTSSRPQNASPSIPTIWLASDSTTAPGGGHNGTQGWGEYLHYSFGNHATVNNSAYAGRSARSFTREGRFERIAAAMRSGDWVVVEFGINDVGVPLDGSTSSTGDKGRADCPGAGEEVCRVVFNNVTEVVQTFPTYIKSATKKFLSLGAAGVILAEQLPTNVWQTGSFVYKTPIFAYYSMLSTLELSGPAANVYYVQHGNYAAQAQKMLDKQLVDANYPMDNTHTAPFLADVHSQAFVLGLKCGTSPLANLVVNATARIEALRGPCLPANDTIPI